jgi:uncharacterized protein (DUF433 family)
MTYDIWTPDNDRARVNGWRTEPLYSIPEAARLAHVSPNTVRRWLYGYVPNSRAPEATPPLFGESPDSPFVSFLQLIEIVLASDFRKVSHVKLDIVRRAYGTAKESWGVQYPFAHLNLESLGGHIIRWMKSEDKTAPSAQAVDEPEQWALPGLVLEEIHKLDYEEQLAARWYPVGKEVPIVVDPLLSSGLPTIPSRGVTVGAIYRRWKDDQPISFIADDLQVDATLIERVLQYADKIAA